VLFEIKQTITSFFNIFILLSSKARFTSRATGALVDAFQYLCSSKAKLLGQPVYSSKADPKVLRFI
jgi:hypothetical protein